MTNDRLFRVRHCHHRLGYRLLRSEPKASLRKKPRAFDGARSGFSQPTKESFLTSRLAQTANVLLHLSISLLLKRGQRLLLLRGQNRLQERNEFCALGRQFCLCAGDIGRKRTNGRLVARILLDCGINRLLRLQHIHHVGLEGLLVVREVLFHLLLLSISEIQFFQEEPKFMVSPSMMMFVGLRRR